MEFKQEHVKILREALAFVGNQQHAGFQKVAVDALKRFADSVKHYCDHTDWVYVAHWNKNACLFCGERFDPILQGELPLQGGTKK